MAYQRREGLNVSGTIDDATASRLGITAGPAPTTATAAVSIDAFPVQGPCGYGDTWHAPRGGGRLHIGVDIIASQGKLLYAVTDGTISKKYWDYEGSTTGNGLRLTRADGTYFTYLHLLDFAPGLEQGAKVKAGQTIGFVGGTGSAATPHLHLEVRPANSDPINPYPIVKAVDACKVTTPLPQP
jgi:murein DD-endopeptidase MepM/ murein hydrolase activator NlpD